MSLCIFLSFYLATSAAKRKPNRKKTSVLNSTLCALLLKFKSTFVSWWKAMKHIARLTSFSAACICSLNSKDTRNLYKSTNDTNFEERKKSNFSFFSILLFQNFRFQVLSIHFISPFHFLGRKIYGFSKDVLMFNLFQIGFVLFAWPLDVQLCAFVHLVKWIFQHLPNNKVSNKVVWYGSNFHCAAAAAAATTKCTTALQCKCSLCIS